LTPISGVAGPDIGIPDIGPDINTDIGCHQILCLKLTLSGVAGPDIGIPDIGSDIEPDIGYVISVT
jgi:hypothetical protein